MRNCLILRKPRSGRGRGGSARPRHRAQLSRRFHPPRHAGDQDRECRPSRRNAPGIERGRGSGQWHGGPIAGIIDTVGDYALVMLLGRPLPTVNFRVDYLRPAIDTALVVSATVWRSERLAGVVDIDVMNVAGQLLAIGRATYATAA